MDVNMFTILGPELADFPQRSNCDFICGSWRRLDAFIQRTFGESRTHPGCKRRRIFSFAPLPPPSPPHAAKRDARQGAHGEEGETVSDLSAPS